MGIKSKLKNWFFLDEEYEEEVMEEMAEQREEPAFKQSNQKRQNVVSLQSIQKSSKVIVFEPKLFEQAQEIADHLKNRRTVVVNLQQIDRNEGRRIVDFLGGTIYAINGEMTKIGSDIFLCAPDNVEVTGAISESFSQDKF